MRSFVRFRTDTGFGLLPVEQVAEICRAEWLTALPSARAGVHGLIYRGGRSLTVLAPFGPGLYVLIVETGAAPFGILTSEVLGVVSVAEQDLEPAPVGQAHPLVVAVVPREGGREQDLVMAADVIWMRAAA
jgi:chemotaxis signal transduction protein